MSRIFGPYSTHQKRWKKFSDIFLLKDFKEINKKIIVDCGTDDFAYKVNLDFADSCKADGIKISFITGPGAHNSTYWGKSVLKHFEFFKRMIGKNKN